MQLGRAEERLDRQAARPRSWSAQAREEATAAIAELRDLARGISPPVLADRGLEAAVQSLADRAGAEVPVNAEIPTPAAAGGRERRLLRRRRGADQRRQAPPGRAVRVTIWPSTTSSLIVGRRRRPGRGRPGRRRADGPAAAGRGARRLAAGDKPGRARGRRPGGAAVRVVIVEDQRAAARGPGRAAARERDRGRRPGRGRARAAADRRRPQAGPGDLRRAPAAHIHRRGDPGRARGAAPPPRAGDTGALPVRRAGLLGRAAATGESGVGYLLKERVSEVRTFLDAVHRVAAGGTALDREVVSLLVRERHGAAAIARSTRSPRANARRSS